MTLRAATTCVLCLAVATSHASRERWVNVTAHAEWDPGYSLTAVTLRDSLWLLGHKSGTWFSGDGKHWINAPANGPSGGYSAYVVFRNAIYSIGGADNQTHPTRKAVWRSTDGRQWTLVTDNPAWSARVWHTAVVHDDRLWVIGGYDGAYKNDVWYSDDGASWHRATRSAPWDPRCMHASVAYAGRLWILGGRRNIESAWETDFNDVWSSPDGRTWIRATGGAGWSRRYGAAATVWNGQLWLMGGTRFFRSNEIWSTTDGAHWTARGHAAWSPRFALASTVFGDRVWAMGGKESGGRFTNDVWFLDTLTR